MDGFNYITGNEFGFSSIIKKFRCLLYPKNDSLTTITRFNSNKFYSILKNFKTRKEAVQEMKQIYSELEKCLPAYKFYMYSEGDEISFSKKAGGNNEPRGEIHITGVTNSASKLVGFAIILKIEAKKVE